MSRPPSTLLQSCVVHIVSKSVARHGSQVGHMLLVRSSLDSLRVRPSMASKQERVKQLLALSANDSTASTLARIRGTKSRRLRLFLGHLTPLLTPLSAQYAETAGNREQSNWLR